MKTLITTLAVAFFTLSLVPTGFAADEKSKMEDCCMMKDGKMMMMKGGETKKMKAEMTMKDGTKVMTDGTVMMKDGKKAKMADGDMIDMSGKMTKAQPATDGGRKQ